MKTWSIVAIMLAAGALGCGGSGAGKPDAGGGQKDTGAGDVGPSTPDVVPDRGDAIVDAATADVNDAPVAPPDGTASDALTTDAAPDAASDAVATDAAPDAASDAVTGEDAASDASGDAEVSGPQPCQAVSDGAYYVDPLNGSNTTGTGTAACPFAGLNRAVTAILAAAVDGGPANVPAGTKILLRGDTSVGAFTLPPNVTLSSDVPASPRTITVPTGSDGFLLVAPGSALANLVIDGKSKGLVGIRVSGGMVGGRSFLPDSATTTVTNVKVTNMASDGILVSAGGLGIREGVIVTQSGFNTDVQASRDGLHITGGTVTIDVGAGKARTGFDFNDGNGIEVSGTGRLLLTGKPDLTGFPGTDPPAVTSGEGTVTANRNLLANVAIAQTAQPCVIDGLVTWRSSGAGIALAAGTSVTVRNSVAVRNSWGGVHISRSFGSVALPTNLNLGDDVTPGHNILQVAGANANPGAGLCVADLGNASTTILAKGNFFSGKDCSVATVPVTTLNLRPSDCQVTSDVGMERSQPNVKVDLSACQSL